MTEQFASVMALELASLHNDLSVWRNNFMQQQIGVQTNIRRSVQSELDGNKEMFEKLQKSFSNLTLRHGLIVTEKKATEQKLADIQRLEKNHQDRLFKTTEQQIERAEWTSKIESINE